MKIRKCKIFDKNHENLRRFLKPEIMEAKWTISILTSKYLLYEFPRGNQVDGLPRVSHSSGGAYR